MTGKKKILESYNSGRWHQSCFPQIKIKISRVDCPSRNGLRYRYSPAHHRCRSSPSHPEDCCPCKIQTNRGALRENPEPLTKRLSSAQKTTTTAYKKDHRCLQNAEHRFGRSKKKGHREYRIKRQGNPNKNCANIFIYLFFFMSTKGFVFKQRSRNNRLRWRAKMWGKLESTSRSFLYTNITRKGQTAFAQAQEMTGKRFATNAELLPTQITKVCFTSRSTTVTDTV